MITFSNVITISKDDEAYAPMLEHAKANLVFDNPEYLKKQQMGLWLGKTPKTIKMYNATNQGLVLPYGMKSKLANCVMINPRPATIRSRIDLRKYQHHAALTAYKNGNGILLMFAGSGKTQTALHAISYFRQKTLWITHTVDLITQANQRAIDNLVCRTSLITEGKCDLSGDIVFATVQTLIKFVRDETIDMYEFGAIIVDECHRCAVNADSLGMFQQCVEYFACSYKIGLTATDHRADGLFAAVHAILGDTLFEMVRDDKRSVFSCQSGGEEVCTVPIAQFQCPAVVKQIRTDYNINGKDHLYSPDGGTIMFSKLITDLTEDISRNALIVEKLRSLSGRHTLIVSDRVDQLQALCKQVSNGAYIDGKTKKAVREKVIQDMRDGKVNYLFGTYKLCKEGLDIVCVDNIVLASPAKDYAVIVQTIGRGQRPSPGKAVCTVWDYCDVECGFLKNMMYKRNSVYNKNGIGRE